MNEEKEQNLYGGKARETLEENDEISEAEEGFMKGYDEDVNPSECANCHELLDDIAVHEEIINNKEYRFCSESCAEKFERKKEHI